MIRVFLILVFFASPLRATELAPGGISGTAKNPQSACIALVNSPVCQDLTDKKGLMTDAQCSTQASVDASEVLALLGHCSSGVGMSIKDMVSFLGRALMYLGQGAGVAAQGIYGYLTDGDARSATQESLKSAMEEAEDYMKSVLPYLLIEYNKAYSEVSGIWAQTEASRILKAGMDLQGKLISGLLGGAWNLIKTQFEEISCYDRQTQAEMACKLASDIFIPPTAFFALLSKGPKALKEMPELMSKLKEMYRKKSNLQEGINPMKGIGPGMGAGAAAGSARYEKIVSAIEEKWGTKVIVDEKYFLGAYKNAKGYAIERKNEIYLNPKLMNDKNAAAATLLHEMRHVRNDIAQQGPAKISAHRAYFARKITFRSEQGGLGVRGYENLMRSDEVEAHLITAKFLDGVKDREGPFYLERGRKMRQVQMEMLQAARSNLMTEIKQNKSLPAKGNIRAKKFISFPYKGKPIEISMDLLIEKGQSAESKMLQMIELRLQMLKDSKLGP